jgi:hypothetical protein
LLCQPRNADPSASGHVDNRVGRPARPRLLKRRSWHTDLEEGKLDAELKFLRKEVYQREIDINCREIAAFERFSSRD